MSVGYIKNKNLLAFNISSQIYNNVKQSLKYLQAQAGKTTQWFTYDAIKIQDGSYDIIFDLKENAVSQMMDELGNKNNVQVLANIVKLGPSKISKKPNDKKERYIVQFLDLDATQKDGINISRTAASLNSKEPGTLNIGEIPCSICGKKNKFRNNLFIVKKKDSNSNAGYIFVGSSCASKILGSQKAAQYLIDMFNAIANLRSIKDNAKKIDITSILKPFNSKLDEIINEYGYKNLAKTYDKSATIENNPKLYKNEDVAIDKLRFRKLDDMKTQQDLLLYDIYTNSNIKKGRSLSDDVLNLLSKNSLKKENLKGTFLSPEEYKKVSIDNIAKKLTYDKVENSNELINNIYDKYNSVKDNIKMFNDFLNKNSKISGYVSKEFNEKKYPVNVYHSEVLEMIKSSRQLNNSSLRSSREIIMSTQEHRLFTKSQRLKMETIIRKALRNEINPKIVNDMFSGFFDAVKFNEKLANNSRIIDNKEKIDEQLKELLDSLNSFFSKVDNIYKDSYKKAIVIFDNQQLQKKQEKEKSNSYTDHYDLIANHPWKGNWGSKIFTPEEISDLRQAKEIKFNYRGRTTKGKLGFDKYNGNLFFGFVPSFATMYDENGNEI